MPLCGKKMGNEQRPENSIFHAPVLHFPIKPFVLTHKQLLMIQGDPTCPWPSFSGRKHLAKPWCDITGRTLTVINTLLPPPLQASFIAPFSSHSPLPWEKSSFPTVAWTFPERWANFCSPQLESPLPRQKKKERERNDSIQTEPGESRGSS